VAEQKIEVQLPRNLLTAARSRTRPSDTEEKGLEIRQQPAYNLINNATRNYRDASQIVTLIRHLARAEGPFATAVHNMVEVAATKYKVFAYDTNTHQLSADGTRVALSVISAMDTPTDYTGMTQKRSIDETVKMLIRETLLTGMVSSELVLNKARQPDRIQVVGAETLIWRDDGNGGVTPAQQISGQTDPVDLNIPTFFAVHLSPDPSTVSPRSMMEACIKMLVYFGEFMDEIRRSVRQAGHNRLTVGLDAEKIAKTAPRDVQNDPKKLAEYLGQVKSAIEDTLANIEPEQALVFFNSADADVLQSGTGTRIDYNPLLNVITGQYATAMKTPPSVLGLRLEGGSQQMGSVETLIYLKSAKALQTPVETVMSRILTLACRLLGSDVYVWFRMDPLDLRPERELEAFLTMRDSRILDRLSLGLISDDEAAIEMDCFPRPPGAPDLSGTMFRKEGSQAQANAGDTPMGRDLQPDKDAPRKGGGRSQ
jgi:hypothetical protein